MNRGQMRDRVRFTLGLNEIQINDEAALVNSWLQEGVEDVVQRTRPSTRVINLTLTGETPIHDMSNTIVSLLDVEDDGVFLDRFSREDITLRQRLGQDGYCYEEPLLWISPVPTVDKAIRAYGVFRPNQMTSDTDDPSSPQFGGIAPSFHPYILNYALWKGGEYVQHEMSAGGEKWRVMYEGQDGTGGDIARMKSILVKRVTPHGYQRRDLTGNLGVLDGNEVYLSGGGR